MQSEVKLLILMNNTVNFDQVHLIITIRKANMSHKINISSIFNINKVVKCIFQCKNQFQVQ